MADPNEGKLQPICIWTEIELKTNFFAKNSASTCVCLDMCYNQANQLTPSCQANELQHSVRTFGSPTWQVLPHIVVNLLTLPNHCNVDGLRKEETSCNNVSRLCGLSFHSRASTRVNIHKEASGLDSVSINTSKNSFITLRQLMKKIYPYFLTLRRCELKFSVRQKMIFLKLRAV